MEAEGGKEDGDETASNKGYSSQCCDLIFSKEARKELKAIFKLTWPTVLTYLAEESQCMVTLMFCGHLGAVPLAAVALALSFTNITGYGIAFGLTSAFDTFCTQAMGANQMKRIGLVIQRGLWILGVACFFVWAIWLNAEWLLLFMDQEKDVARQAGIYCDIMSIGLPGRFAYILLQKYLQTVGHVLPTLLLGISCGIFHAIVSYILIFSLDLGIRGAAFGMITTESCYAMVLFLYIRYRTEYHLIWPGWSSESLLDWGVFAKMALSGMFMIIIDNSTFEAGAFLLGALNVEELGAFAIINQLSAFLSMIPLGISLAASILVGNALGSGQSGRACAITKRCILVGLFCAMVLVTVILAVKDHISYAFTDDMKVAAIATKSMIVFALFFGFDSIQMIVGGVLRGCGQQHYGMMMNFVSYTIIGLPLAIVLAAFVKLYNFGFWLGVSVAVVLQLTGFLVILLKTDWKKASMKARNRAGIENGEGIVPQSPISSCIATTSAGSSTTGNKDGIIEESEGSASTTSSVVASHSGSLISTAEEIEEEIHQVDCYHGINHETMMKEGSCVEVIWIPREYSHERKDKHRMRGKRLDFHLHNKLPVLDSTYNPNTAIIVHTNPHYISSKQEHKNTDVNCKTALISGNENIKDHDRTHVSTAVDMKMTQKGTRRRNRITAKVKATRLLIVIFAVFVWIVAVFVRVLFPAPNTIGQAEEFRTSNLTSFNTTSSYMYGLSYEAGATYMTKF